MVVFGLFASKRHVSVGDTVQSTSSQQTNTSDDILGTLMGLNSDVNNAYEEPKQRDNASDFNTSSFNLDDIMNRMSTKRDIDFKYALINSLYAQVEYLRKDALAKNDIINLLVKYVPKYSKNIEEKIHVEGDMCSRNEITNSKSSESFSSSSSEICESGESHANNLDFIADGSVLSDIECETRREPIDLNEQLKEVRDTRRYEFYATKYDDDFRAWEEHTAGFGVGCCRRWGIKVGVLVKKKMV